jgi:hypothetical protein
MRYINNVHIQYSNNAHIQLLATSEKNSNEKYNTDFAIDFIVNN